MKHARQEVKPVINQYQQQIMNASKNFAFRFGDGWQRYELPQSIRAIFPSTGSIRSVSHTDVNASCGHFNETVRIERGEWMLLQPPIRRVLLQHLDQETLSSLCNAFPEIMQFVPDVNFMGVMIPYSEYHRIYNPWADGRRPNRNTRPG